MRKIQTLGIILAVVMLFGSIPMGFSEPLKEQLEKGIEPENIQCDNSSHVLVQRTNGKLACVSEKSAEKMNWEIVENKINSVSTSTQDLYDNTSSVLISSTEILDDAKEILIDDSSTVTANKIESDSLTSERGVPIEYQFPKFSIEYPKTAQVGEAFDIEYKYTFVDPNDNERVCSIERCGDKELTLLFPTYTSLLDREGFDQQSVITNDMYYETDLTYHEDTIKNIYHEDIDYKTEVFTFVIEEPTHNYYGGGISLYTSSEDYPHGIGFYIHQSGNIYFDIEVGNLEQFKNNPREGEILDLTHKDDYFEPIRGQQSPQPVEPQYIPEEIWGDFAEFLRAHYPNEDIPNWLVQENMSEKFIDDFLTAYPEFDNQLKSQSFQPFFNFLVPSAFAQTSSTSFVYGTVKHFDIDNRKVALKDVKVCGYQFDQTQVGENRYSLLYNGQTIIRKFLV